MFEWGEEAEQVFQELKHLLIRAPILAYADYSLPYVLQTNRNLKGLGVVLTSSGWQGMGGHLC